MSQRFRQAIKWTRGDEHWLRVYVVDEDNAVMSLADVAKVSISIGDNTQDAGSLTKNSVDDSGDFDIDTTGGTVDIFLTATETGALSPRELVMDIQLEFNNGEKLSLPKVSFIVEEGMVNV